MSWERAREKFERLTADAASRRRATQLAEAVAVLDELETRDLTTLLAARGRARDDERRAR